MFFPYIFWFFPYISIFLKEIKKFGLLVKLVLLVLLALLVLLIRLMTKHRQLRCLPFPEEAVSLSLSCPLVLLYSEQAFGLPRRPSASSPVTWGIMGN